MSPATRWLACAATLSCLLIPPAHAEDSLTLSIIVTQAWSRATPGGSKVAGGYLTIENKGPGADRLLSGSTEVANKLEIHEMAVTDGVMKMRPVEGGLAIDAGKTLKFAPGGLHLMLVGLAAPLVRGDKVAVVLRFEKAGEVPVSFEVQALGASAPGPLSSAAPAADATVDVASKM
jgi:periplasmic copper chaperone A